METEFWNAAYSNVVRCTSRGSGILRTFLLNDPDVQFSFWFWRSLEFRCARSSLSRQGMRFPAHLVGKAAPPQLAEEWPLPGRRRQSLIACIAQLLLEVS